MENLVKHLKGGSLSGTYLIIEGDKKFIRKNVSLNENREYGFYRWYSQLKKLQRTGQLFPGVFPKVLRYGIQEKKGYFDIEYIEDSKNGFEFLEKNPPIQEIDEFFDSFIKKMKKLHDYKRESCAEAFELYLSEEVERPLRFCLERDSSLRNFADNDHIYFNENKIRPISSLFEEIYKFADKYYNSFSECYTHGNLTLENTLWVPKDKRVVFIDPYEENVVDNIYNEYSQVLQSSNSYYEVYNKSEAKIEKNRVNLEIERLPGIDYFNKKFLNFMNKNLSEEEIKITRLYEVSQFTRMLPFKLYIAKEKMIFFYTLSSYLLEKLLKEENNYYGS